MQRIWVQLCDRNVIMVIILNNAKARHEREVGFYRHDQWGFACVADEVSITVSSTKGVASDSGCTSISNMTIIGSTQCTMHNHINKIVMVMFMVALCGQFYLKGVYCN